MMTQKNKTTDAFSQFIPSLKGNLIQPENGVLLTSSGLTCCSAAVM